MTCRTVASPVLHCKCCTYLIYTNTSKLKAMYHACIQVASTLQTTKTQCTITKDIYCIDESLFCYIYTMHALPCAARETEVSMEVCMHTYTQACSGQNARVCPWHIHRWHISRQTSTHNYDTHDKLQAHPHIQRQHTQYKDEAGTT